MARQKLTKNQQEYKRQMKRIRQALYRERKKGFDVREAAKVLLEKPTRITQSFINKLKSITPKVIRKQSKYINYTPPKRTPIIEPIETPTQSYTVSTDFGDIKETINVYTGEVIDEQPVDWKEYELAKQEYYEREDKKREQEKQKYEEKYEEPISQEPIYEEPTPAVTQEVPYPEAVGYTKDYITGTAKALYTLYDENGAVIAEIVRTGGDEFVDITTGEVVGGRKDIEKIIDSITDYGRSYTTEAASNEFPDLSDYAIDALYEQTKILSDKTGGTLHNIFDAIRERIGDADFYNALVQSNGFRTAFAELSGMLKAGADYMEAFSRFGASLANTLPLTESERTEFYDMFSEIIQADDADAEV